jgi:glycosyltransferase involved in cell wall biosynthesis
MNVPDDFAHRLAAPARRPDVSVVVPSHDRAHLLPLVVGALLAQTGVEHEVIVVDDGSTDDTAAVLAHLCEHSDRLRTLRHPEARGVAEARNAGVRAARGTHIAFCDDDDLWSPNKLRIQLATMARTGRPWSCTGTIDVNDRWQIIGGSRIAPDVDVVAALDRHDIVPGGGSSVVAHTELVRRTGWFDVTVNGVEDWDYWRRLGRVGPPAYVDRPLVAYRVAAGSISHAVARMQVLQDEIRRRAGHHDGPDLEDLAYLADRALRGGDRLLAARLLRRMARLGAPRRYAAAGLALIAPQRLVERHDRTARETLPDGWMAQGEEWLCFVMARTRASSRHGATWR